jgi:DNA-binding CsgD family transcriptional regulator
MSHQSVSHLLQALGELYQHANLKAFPGIAQRTVRALVAQDTSSYNEVDFSTGRVAGEIDPPNIRSQDIARMLEPYINVHPLIRYFNKTGDGTAHRITDFVTQKRFESSELYRVVFKPIGVRRQISLCIQTPELVLIGVVSNRGGRDFSERDRTVLNLFRPHLVQAYQNARSVNLLQHERGQLDQIARSKQYGVVITTTSGRIDSMIGTANRLLDGFFDPPVSPGRLPELLRNWMADAIKASIELSPRLPLVVNRQGKKLSVRLLRATAGIYHTLVLEPVLPDLPAEPLQAAGMTLREIEVLRWISHGKSNAEIAEILRARPRTIQKHLEHIYEKLQVQTRGAAAAKARALATSGEEFVNTSN